MSKTSWIEAARLEGQLASATEIDMMVAMHPQIVELWKEWCGWRIDLATRDKRKPWTPRAARIEMQNLARALHDPPPGIVETQMRAALTGMWVALNLHHIRPSYQARIFHPEENRPW